MTRHLTLADVAPRLARAQDPQPRRRRVIVVTCGTRRPRTTGQRRR